MDRIVETSLTGNMRFEARLSTGHVVPMDAGENSGGENSAPRPYQLVLVALTGCTGMDVISILRKKRQQVTDMWMEVDAERASDHPKVFTKVNIHFHLKGKNINPAAVARAIELSETKYCSVSENLRGRAVVASEFTIHEE